MQYYIDQVNSYTGWQQTSHTSCCRFHANIRSSNKAVCSVCNYTRPCARWSIPHCIR